MVQDTLDSLVEAFRSYEEADGQSKGEQFERLSFLVASGKDSADAFSSTVLELRELSEQAVFERLGKAIRTYVKDTALKIDAAVRREADKLLQNVTDDIGRVLEAGDHSDEDLHTMKEELSSILKSVHFAEDIEAKFSELQAHLASKMYRMYVDLVENATFKAEKVVDSRLRVVLREIQKLTPKASVDAEPVQEEIHEPTPPPVVPRPQKETHEPTPPPVVPRPPKETHEPTPPPLVPRPQKETHEPIPPPVVPRTQPPTPVPRPATHFSSTESSSAPNLPAKPRPMTVAIVETPASPPSESPRNNGLIADLNRMLAIPPRSPKPPKMDEADSSQHSLTEGELAGSNDEVSHVETIGEASVAAELPNSEVMDPVEPASLSIAVDTVISGSISTSSPLSPIPQASTVSTTAPAPSAAPPQKKKGGFRGMLSSLTKSRPKAARKASGKNDNDESVPDQSSTSVLEVSDSQNIIEGQEGRYSVDTTKESVKDEDSAEPAKIDLSLPVIPTTSSLLDEISDSRKSFHSETDVQPVASSSLTDLETTDKRNSVHSNTIEKEESSSLHEPLTSPPRPVPRPRPAPPPRRPVSEDVSAVGEIPPTSPAEGSPLASVPRPPRPAPRPSSLASHETLDRPLSTHESRTGSTEISVNSESKTEDESEAAAAEEIPGDAAEAPAKRKIPGVFTNQFGHGAMAALASAMTGRQPPPRPPKPSSIPSLAQPEGADAVSHHEIEEVASPTLRPRPVIPSTEHLDHDDDTAAQTAWAPTLALKKKENSNSGDDKAIEKHAIEWLNLHLAAKEIQVDNLYTSLKDGLNLIYALEACTGESVGKYNKRAMLPVHKIDNIAVALNFLNKKGIGTQFLSPQDVMNEDRSKILTLFNYILKRF